MPYFCVKPLPTVAGGSVFAFLAGRGLSKGLFSMATNRRDVASTVPAGGTARAGAARAGGGAGKEVDGVIAGVFIFGDVAIGPGTEMKAEAGSIGNLGIPSR